MKRSLAILFALGVAAAANATNVRGTVLHPNGAAYAGATVTLENAAIGTTAAVFTAEDGVFILRNVPPGQYTMHVRTPRSYKNVTVQVTQQATAEVGSVQTP
jgi:hypothetical protein